MDILFDRFPFKLEPWEHQIDAMKKANLGKGFAYFMEQGTGKTKTVIDEAQVMASQAEINSVTIICPKSLMGTWKDEIITHCVDYQITLWKDKIVYGEGNLRFSIINIDAIKTEKGFCFAYNRTGNKSMLIIDESTSIKNFKAKRTQYALRIAKEAKFKRILTGTPITKNPLDLYSQMLFLDPWFWAGSSFYAFRNRYAVLGGYMGKEVIGFKDLDRLQSQIDPYCFRVKKEQCLDLPPKLYSSRYLELSKDQKSKYKELKKDLGKITLNEETGNIYNKTMVTLGKMHQLVGGNLEEIQYDCNKIEECVNILLEGSGKTLIWCKYINEIKRLKDTLEDNNLKVGTYHGSVPLKQREQNKLDFNTGDMDVLILQYACGGVGLTLNAASTVIFYSNDYSYADRIQAEDRCHRGGQTKSVNYIDLICKGTIDLKILNIIKSKKSLSDAIMEGLRNESLDDLDALPF